MLERTGQILRMACLVLAALLVYQLARIALRGTSLVRVVIPALPTLASDTNAPAAGGGGTNAPGSAAKGTNALASKAALTAGTNLTSTAQPAGKATNPAASGSTTTNALPSGSAKKAASRPRPAGISTNSGPKAEIAETTTNAEIQSISSNAVASATNIQVSAFLSNQNSTVVSTHSTNNGLAKVKSGKKGANAAPPGVMAMPGPGMNIPGMSGMPGMPGMPGKPPQPLPPEIKARVDRIYESQMLGQIIRIPMALLGIAGDNAIIRSPSGQTGLVKEGGTLGEIKLLRIGINRVLVQQDEQKQELTIFNGYGGQSLLTNENNIPK